MGQLILCTGEPAAVPYHMESTSVNIYSLEEMSYYLVHNAYFVDADFMCRGFCDWVRREAKEEELAEELSSCLERGKSLCEFAKILLTRVGYATKEEIEETEEILAQFETKDELEQRKIRADRLLRRKRYKTAMEEYVWILGHVKKDTPTQFQGDVCHNLGVAYAGNFLFAQAAEYFHKAYEKNTNPESLKEELLALTLSGQEDIKKLRAEEYELGEEVLEGYETEIRQVQNRAESGEKYMRMQKRYILSQEPEDEKRKQEIRSMVEKWKQEYKAYGR